MSEADLSAVPVRGTSVPPADGSWTIETVMYRPGSPSLRPSLEIDVAHGGVPAERRTLAFRGVAQLEFAPSTTNMPFRLAVVSIEDRGWDRLRYRVSDGVEGQCRFYCEEVEVTQVSV